MKGARPLTDSEVSSVLREFRGKYRLRNTALFILGLKTGFRISELLSLKVQDIFAYGEVTDQVTVKRSAMKKKIEGRTVALHPEARHSLREWIEELSPVSDDTFLFVSRKGENQPLTRQQAWSILTKAFRSSRLAGKLGCHATRKTFAAKVHERLGRDLLKTQRALGHRSPASTAAYLSFDEADITKAILSL
jgi:integrase